MKNTDYIRNEINRVLSKTRQIYQQLGTMTDCMAIDICQDVDLLPPVTKQDLAIFKRVVDTGVVLDRVFRRPNGYKVYSFLLYLKNRQEEALMKRVTQERKELESLFEGVWERAIEKHNGDRKKAKQEFMAKWGNTELEPYTREIFNNAYKSAIQKWQQTKQTDLTK